MNTDWQDWKFRTCILDYELEMADVWGDLVDLWHLSDRVEEVFGARPRWNEGTTK